MTGRESSDGLDDPEAAIQRASESFANETERKVAEVFAEILELQWVSVDDDIFSLGGDSFEAVRIALELEHRFSVELPIELLEGSGRVRDLAAWIDSQLRWMNANGSAAET